MTYSSKFSPLGISLKLSDDETEWKVTIRPKPEYIPEIKKRLETRNIVFRDSDNRLQLSIQRSREQELTLNRALCTNIF